MKAMILLLIGIMAGGGAGAAYAGQEGHGGDPLAAEFATAGREVLKHLRDSNELAPDVTAEDLEGFDRALASTRIDPTDAKLFDRLGDDVDARVVHDPLRPGSRTRLIQINRAAFYDWLRRGAMLHRLVLHEYLWVIGKNDENYRISSRLEPLDLAPVLAGELKRDICRENWAGPGHRSH